jgi:hypothetical protein
MAHRIVLCIGTKKGLFVAEAAKTRRRFALRGPFGPGVAVYSALIDTRGTPRLYGSSCNAFFGMKVLCSTDLGKNFKETKSAPAFPKDDGRALANIWSLEPGKERRELLCGVEPAALFRSRDGGDSWDMVPGISNHEHARKWQPGNGGLCLHTILREGERVHLGISTGGHYLSKDGGETFSAANKGVGAGFTPEPYTITRAAITTSSAARKKRLRLAKCRKMIEGLMSAGYAPNLSSSVGQGRSPSYEV